MNDVTFILLFAVLISMLLCLCCVFCCMGYMGAAIIIVMIALGILVAAALVYDNREKE